MKKKILITTMLIAIGAILTGVGSASNSVKMTAVSQDLCNSLSGGCTACRTSGGCDSSGDCSLYDAVSCPFGEELVGSGSTKWYCGKGTYSSCSTSTGLCVTDYNCQWFAGVGCSTASSGTEIDDSIDCSAG